MELEQDSGAEPLQFAPGDHVGVLAGNPAELVAGILKHLPDAPPINQSLCLEYLNTSDTGELSSVIAQTRHTQTVHLHLHLTPFPSI